jgi:hypothetical protein
MLRRVAPLVRLSSSLPARALSQAHDPSANPTQPYDHYEDQMKMYNNSREHIARWLDMSVTKSNGRLFDADSELLDVERTILFPDVKCSSLDGQPAVIPSQIQADAKLVVLSFKQYGFQLVRSWLDPFVAHFSSYQGNQKIVAMELCFIEHSFLSMAKGVFASGIRRSVAPSQLDKTFLTFGGINVRIILSSFNSTIITFLYFYLAIRMSSAIAKLLHWICLLA